MLGISEKLKVKTTGDEERSDLNVLQRNAQRLKRLIDQLLNLSRIEAGQMKLKAAEESLVPLVRGYLQFFESAANQKGIELSFESEKEDIFCYVDREKMEQILYNLFSNALKFTPEGGRVAVSVGSRQLAVGSKMENIANCQLPTADFQENCTVISISDTGPGIAPDRIDRIFDRFYQADDSDSRFQEGSGIGLALVRELVELHHGEIKAESEVGIGSTFTIYLPMGAGHLKEEEKRRRGEEEREDSSQSVVDYDTLKRDPETWTPQPPKGGVIKKKSPLGDLGVDREPATDQPLLLIVEDNPDMRYYLRNILEGNYRLIEAENGNSGIKIAGEQIPDLVVSDVMMPEMDGYEFCKQMKSDERTSHIPVILLTAKAGMEDKLEGLETGADDFITKPFQPQELLIRVRNLIEQRRKLSDKYRREFEHLSLEPDESMSSMDARFMERVKKVLEENLANSDFDVTQFSRMMNLSRSQLHRKLTALFGLSASTFIRIYRLNAAARLLKARTGNVTEVAFEVGFNNLAYFSRCFREQFGVNPSEYPEGNSK
jgi:DNA-binding response OmpR family regulator